jgi:hypothetical protein
MPVAKRGLSHVPFEKHVTEETLENLDDQSCEARQDQDSRHSAG